MLDRHAPVLLLGLLVGCGGPPSPPDTRPTDLVKAGPPVAAGLAPAAKGKAEELIEQILAATEVKNEVKQADALFALEKEDKALFEAVRNYVRGEERGLAISDIMKMGAKGRPALPLLRAHLASLTSRVAATAKTTFPDQNGTASAEFEQVLAALVQLDPDWPDLVPTLARFAAFKTVSPLPKAQQVKGGPTETVYEWWQLRESVVKMLSGLVRRVPSARKALAEVVIPMLDGQGRLLALSTLPQCGEFAVPTLPAIKKLRLDADAPTRAAADTAYTAIDVLATAVPTLDKLAPKGEVSKLVAVAFDHTDPGVKVLAWLRLEEASGDVAEFARFYSRASGGTVSDPSASVAEVVRRLSAVQKKPAADADGLLRLVVGFYEESPQWLHGRWDEMKQVQVAALKALARLAPDDQQQRKKILSYAAALLPPKSRWDEPGEQPKTTYEEYDALLSDPDLGPVLVSDPDILARFAGLGEPAAAGRAARLVKAHPNKSAEVAEWLCQRDEFANALVLCGNDGKKALAPYRKAADDEEEIRKALQTIADNNRKLQLEERYRPATAEREEMKRFLNATLKKYDTETASKLAGKLKFNNERLTKLQVALTTQKEKWTFTEIPANLGEK